MAKAGGEEVSKDDEWEWYVTAAGGKVVQRELSKAFGTDTASLARLERIMNLRAGRQSAARHSKHLRGDIHEIRVNGAGVTYRLLFARHQEGRVLLALRALKKTTPKLPPADIEVAEARWADWRRRKRLN